MADLFCSIVKSTFFLSQSSSTFTMDLLDDYNVSRRLEPWVKGPEDLGKLHYIIRVPEGHVLDEWRMDAERIIEYARSMDVLTIGRRTIVGDAFQWFCDIPWFITQLYDNPGFVSKFFGIFRDWSKQLTELALELDLDVLQYRGWYEIPTFFGLKFWKQYFSAVLEEQAELVHSAGRLLDYLLPEGQGAYADLLKESGVDILEGVDPRMLHGGDLAGLFGKCGDSKAFWGGVNAEVTLESKDYGRIEKEVKEAIDILGTNGGLILSAFIFGEVPHEGIMHFIEAWRKHR